MAAIWLKATHKPVCWSWLGSDSIISICAFLPVSCSGFPAWLICLDAKQSQVQSIPGILKNKHTGWQKTTFRIYSSFSIQPSWQWMHCYITYFFTDQILLFWNDTNSRGTLYTHRIQRFIILHLFTDLFCKDLSSLVSRVNCSCYMK